MRFTTKLRFKEIGCIKNHVCILSGGWWCAEKIEEIFGSVAIEIGNMTYIEALDNGLFKLGRSHDIGTLVTLVFKHYLEKSTLN